ncbi:MAG: U32 family peptidase [Erysipelotrichaceae bacterium]
MLISTLSNIEEISEINIDVWLLSLKGYSWKANTYFTLEQIEDIIKNNSKEFWVVINKMVEEDDLAIIKETLIKLKQIGVKGIVYCSLAVYQLAKSLEMTDLLIYQADTLITNKKDAEVFKELNKAVIIAKELPIKDILNIVGDNYADFGMHIHGFLNMSYSKRKFLTNYFAYLNQDFNNKGNYFLQEETRSLKMPILEEELGTSIYTGWILESLEYFKEINLKVKYLIIDSLFLSSSQLQATVAAYHCLIAGGSLEQARGLLPLVKNHDYNTGYHNLKTKKTQEEITNE